jgi:hypothetical protein
MESLKKEKEDQIALLKSIREKEKQNFREQVTKLNERKDTEQLYKASVNKITHLEFEIEA